MLRCSVRVLFVATLLSACASIPDVEYSYYMAKMNGVATVTQSVSCTPDKAGLIIVNTPSFVPTYSADLNRGAYKISIRDIEGTFRGFADSDASFSFYDDGRLKTINQGTTGQGEAAIKSIVSLGTTVLGVAGAHIALVKTLPECDIIDKWAGPPKPGEKATVSLSYRSELNFPGNPPPIAGIEIKPVDSNLELYSQLSENGRLPKLKMWFGQPSDSGSRAARRLADVAAPSVKLTLQKVATVEVKITADQKPIFKANVAVPAGDTYDLPIPKAALFGDQKFALTLSEAGAITAVDYSKKTGVAGAANAGASIATALTPESTSAKASDLKAQADLMAQQARPHRCQVSPATCN
jgi:hypothetical protein